MCYEKVLWAVARYIRARSSRTVARVIRDLMAVVIGRGTPINGQLRRGVLPLVANSQHGRSIISRRRPASTAIRFLVGTISVDFRCRPASIATAMPNGERVVERGGGADFHRTSFLRFLLVGA